MVLKPMREGWVAPGRSLFLASMRAGVCADEKTGVVAFALSANTIIDERVMAALAQRLEQRRCKAKVGCSNHLGGLHSTRATA